MRAKGFHPWRWLLGGVMVAGLTAGLHFVALQVIVAGAARASTAKLLSPVGQAAIELRTPGAVCELALDEAEAGQLRVTMDTVQRRARVTADRIFIWSGGWPFRGWTFDVAKDPASGAFVACHVRSNGEPLTIQFEQPSGWEEFPVPQVDSRFTPTGIDPAPFAADTVLYLGASWGAVAGMWKLICLSRSVGRT